MQAAWGNLWLGRLLKGMSLLLLLLLLLCTWCERVQAGL
jgi:hypothetical protein